MMKDRRLQVMAENQALMARYGGILAGPARG
jgi:hypothetical protein